MIDKQLNVCLNVLVSIKRLFNCSYEKEGGTIMEMHVLPHDHGQNEGKILEKLPTVEECRMVAEIFKQLSDGTRLRILWFLCHCEECVSNIAAAMEMSNPAISHHLKTLKNTGLIVSRRDGKEIYYMLADTQVAEHIHRICEEIFQITCPLERVL